MVTAPQTGFSIGPRSSHQVTMISCSLGISEPLPTLPQQFSSPSNTWGLGTKVFWGHFKGFWVGAGSGIFLCSIFVLCPNLSAGYSEVPIYCSCGRCCFAVGLNLSGQKNVRVLWVLCRCSGIHRYPQYPEIRHPHARAMWPSRCPSAIQGHRHQGTKALNPSTPQC